MMASSSGLTTSTNSAFHRYTPPPTSSEEKQTPPSNLASACPKYCLRIWGNRSERKMIANPSGLPAAIPATSSQVVPLAQHKKHKKLFNPDGSSCWLNGDNTTLSQCPHCLVSFLSAEHLQIHILHHHGGQNGAFFSCVFCRVGFHSDIHLRLHYFEHTSEPRYDCPQCGALFYQAAHAQAHRCQPGSA